MSTTDQTLEGHGHDTPIPNKPTPAAQKQRSLPKRWIIAAAVVVAGAGLWALTAGGHDGAEADAAVGPINSAEVVMTDLVEAVSFDGTLGTVSADPITASSDGTITALAAIGSTVAETETLYRIDDQATVLLYGESPAYRNIALGSESMTVGAGTAGVVTQTAAPGAVIEQGDPLFWIDGQPVIALYGTTPAYRDMRDLGTNLVGDDIAQLESALGELGFDLDGTLGIDGEFNYYTGLAVADWQEAAGLVIDSQVNLGEVVFVPGPSQIVDFDVAVGQTVNPDTAIVTLATGDPTVGPDVAQLEQALADLGFDAGDTLIVDDTFTTETRTAIIEFQIAVGQKPDGVVNLGEIVFSPGPIRISDLLAAVGSNLNQGEPVIAISSAEQVVRMDLPAADQQLLDIGDPVTVVLADFTDTPATVVSIAATASVTNDGDTAFETTIALDDPAAAGSLDEAPVTVDVIGDSVTDVMAIPVTALIALNEGGYAVELDTAGGYQLVAVEPGFYADGLVAITSNSVAVGDTVTLP